MAFEGTALTKDESTGFLEANLINGFSALDKVKFIRLFRESYNVSKTCEAIGVNRITFMHHREHDIAFQKALLECRETVCDNLEETAYKTALKAEGVRDRWKILETQRPEVWGKPDQNNPVINITIDSSAIANHAAKELAIDAQVVKES